MRVDRRILCRMYIVVALDTMGAVPLLHSLEFFLNEPLGSFSLFLGISPESGNFQIPVTLCNFEVALPVTFFGGAHVAPRTSHVL